MRTKTDEKRQAIVDAAIAVFEESGYERASMTSIASKVGGSKATLYNYFSSKEALFAASMTHALEERGERVLKTLEEPGEVGRVLRAFGERHLEFLAHPDMLAIQRTVINDGHATGVGREVYQIGPQRIIDALAAFLAARHATGEIVVAHPELAALQFKALLEAGIVEPLLYGSEPISDLRQAAEVATVAFLKICV
jgi:AcrR family transcriptional regulator